MHSIAYEVILLNQHFGDGRPREERGQNGLKSGEGESLSVAQKERSEPLMTPGRVIIFAFLTAHDPELTGCPYELPWWA
jgi:hypothetical protein